jgi:hypothetical protein
MPKRVFIEAKTPLGYHVVLTRDRWREIVRFKHPAAAAYQAKVRTCLEEPDIIRASSKVADVHVYYLKVDRIYVCVVVAPQDHDRYFVVTIYLTKRIKPGDELWTK